MGEVFTLPDDQIVEGPADFGGIWVAAKIGGANTLIKYMATQYDLQCRLFAVQIGRILYQNSYRMKTDSVLFLEELTPKLKTNFSLKNTPQT